MVGPMAIPAEALWRTAEAVAVVAAATIGACVLNVVSSKTSKTSYRGAKVREGSMG